MQYFCERMQHFSRELKGERNTFTRGHKAVQRNAILLREEVKVLQENTKFLGAM